MQHGGWGIRLTCQPPNSLETNVNDLGFFASLQASFHKMMPQNLEDICKKLQKAFRKYSPKKLNRIFLTHMTCMREIIRHKGSNFYKIPHIKKRSLENNGGLLDQLGCEQEFVAAAEEYLNAVE